VRVHSITSSDNPKFKAALKLLSRRGRSQQDRVAVFGIRETLRAIAAGARVDEIFLCPELLQPADCEYVQSRWAAIKANVYELPKSLFSRLAYGERDDGLLAIAERPKTDLSRIVLPPNALVVVLESVEKPGNIGAVARSADAVGADALILASPRCDLFHPNCIRASLGCIFGLNTADGDSAEVKSLLARKDIAIVAADPNATKLYHEVDLAQGIALVFGSEAKGLSDVWSDERVTKVRLPMKGLADSLNVSVTAAVMMFEAARQRRK
jgi:TrmH family RNA methyltransferase